MLVLTRKTGERIVAGEINIVVLRTLSGRVVLGIDAPDDVRIMRGEIIDWREHDND
jgi:carbon storage regulator CsrA